MTNKEQGLEKIKQLVARFNEQLPVYKKSEYNETQTRRDFIDPFFNALGWDIDNSQGVPESYRDVIHEDRVKVGNATKAPDYSFRVNGKNKLFFVEAKKPSIVIKDSMQPAYQVRRYGWSAKMGISIITDFEEFAIYNCNKKPNPTDKPSVARVKYFTFADYEKEWDFLWNTFSKEAVVTGNFDKFIKSNSDKKGTATVDKEFLLSLDQWRTLLAETISKENKQLDEDELNFVVQQTLDRIIFLRICEGRAIEPYANLQAATKNGDYYKNLIDLFKEADDKYNSGLFNFKKDQVSQQISINNRTIKTILNQLYYPESPYEFSVLSVEILGSAYEQFLGKTITINNLGKAVIELKPEVRKAGGVYYTPQYIVDYIVENTVGKLCEQGNMTPSDVAKIKIVDPACGSGSFLLGAYQYLLNWHLDYWTRGHDPLPKNKIPLTPNGTLSTGVKKQILLNNIFGVDIDTNAVEVTKLSLLLKCMEGETQASIAHQMTMFKERVLPTLDDNIKSGNSLIDTDYYDNQLDFGEERKIKPFNWQKAFPSVFNRVVEIDKTLPFKEQYNKVKKLEQDTQELIKNLVSEPQAEYGKKYNGGFDVVIGNPPYVIVFNDAAKLYLENKYPEFQRNNDLYVSFISKGLNLLNENGLLSFITPNTFLKGLYFGKLRENIKKYNLIEIIDFKSKLVFADANVFTSVFLISKSKSTSNDIKFKTEINSNIQFVSRLNSVFVVTNPIIEKLKEHKTFNDYFIVKDVGYNYWSIGNGKKRENSIGSRILYKGIKEKENDIPYLKGSNFNRYSIEEPTQYLRHNYSDYLDSNDIFRFSAEILETTPKIIYRQTSSSLIGTIENNKYHNDKTVHIILNNKFNSIDLRYVLGIFNSQLLNYLYKSYSNEDGRVFAQVKTVNIKSLPFILGTIESQNKIIGYVEQLLQLNKDLQAATLESKKEQIKTKIDYHEDKINALVYALYELTEEEIKTVENG